jgi:hypothetical protein
MLHLGDPKTLAIPLLGRVGDATQQAEAHAPTELISPETEEKIGDLQAQIRSTTSMPP